MPYPNEHALRVNEPGKYEKFTRKTLTEGVDAILGWKGKSSEVQALRFDKKKFTAEEAKAWAKKHDFSGRFEAAAKENDREAEPKFGDMRVPVSEQVNGGMTGRDLADTSDEMWKARNKINEIMNDMTVDECLKFVEAAEEFKKGLRSKGA